jgi:uncharacterized membrane protein
MSGVSLILLARALHVIAGIVWAGVIVVLITTVMPLARRHAQDGAERWAALVARRAGPLTGVAALLTILSGGYLMAALHPGDTTVAGIVLDVGAVAGVLAFIIGAIVARPLGRKLAEARAAQVSAQDLHRLRRRSALRSTVMVSLVVVAVLCMALFRYAPMLS